MYYSPCCIDCYRRGLRLGYEARHLSLQNSAPKGLYRLRYLGIPYNCFLIFYGVRSIHCFRIWCAQQYPSTGRRPSFSSYRLRRSPLKYAYWVPHFAGANQ